MLGYEIQLCNATEAYSEDWFHSSTANMYSKQRKIILRILQWYYDRKKSELAPCIHEGNTTH